jgi:hypothetical protein
MPTAARSLAEPSPPIDVPRLVRRFFVFADDGRATGIPARGFCGASPNPGFFGDFMGQIWVSGRRMARGNCLGHLLLAERY